jgi:hypothetical protein
VGSIRGAAAGWPRGARTAWVDTSRSIQLGSPGPGLGPHATAPISAIAVADLRSARGGDTDEQV